jgi:hypothetical protein
LLKDGTIKPKDPSEPLQTIFYEATRVGQEAKKLFPGGKENGFRKEWDRNGKLTL